jgi:CRP-like cAMP-binding protein
MSANLSSKIVRDFVQGTKWCTGLTDAQRARVMSEIREREVPAGSMVCKVGRPVEFWKGVVSGLAKMSLVSSNGRSLTFTGIAAGGWFGEGPVLRSDKWDFDGVAMHDTHLALVPRATFQWLLAESSSFNSFVISQLNERLTQCLSIIEAERLETASTRVARCLAGLFNPVLYPNADQQLQLTQQEIGYLSGVSRQGVNRTLGRLREEGIVEVHHGAIVVIDVVALRKFSG